MYQSKKYKSKNVHLVHTLFPQGHQTIRLSHLTHNKVCSETRHTEWVTKQIGAVFS